MATKETKMDFKSILKEVQYLGSAHMTWKEKKELENKKVVSLGGKAPKKQRLPLSVARVMMKKQKERDQKIQEENLILGRFGGNNGGSSRRASGGRRRPEDMVLKSTEGHFRNGVLDVKELLKPSGPKPSAEKPQFSSKGKKKKGGKKNKGKKKKGPGRKRH